jgi:hypothetical protein
MRMRKVLALGIWHRIMVLGFGTRDLAFVTTPGFVYDPGYKYKYKGFGEVILIVIIILLLHTTCPHRFPLQSPSGDRQGQTKCGTRWDKKKG